MRPKGVADGQQVNIPVPESADGCRLITASRISEENPRGHSTVRVVTRPYGRKVSDFTLPGKTSKESSRCPYHKPTQVDEVNIHRRSREHSLRN